MQSNPYAKAIPFSMFLSLLDVMAETQVDFSFPGRLRYGVNQTPVTSDLKIRFKKYGSEADKMPEKALYLADLDFSRCRFDMVEFPVGTRFHACYFVDATFYGCDLSGVTFEGCHMTHCEFEVCNVKGMDFQGTRDTRKGLSWVGCDGLVLYANGKGVSTEDRSFLALLDADGELRFHIGCQHENLEGIREQVIEERGPDHSYLKLIDLAVALKDNEKWQEPEEDEDEEDFDDDDDFDDDYEDDDDYDDDAEDD